MSDCVCPTLGGKIDASCPTCGLSAAPPPKDEDAWNLTPCPRCRKAVAGVHECAGPPSPDPSSGRAVPSFRPTPNAVAGEAAFERLREHVGTGSWWLDTDNARHIIAYVDALRARAESAEKERDEARRERDTLAAQCEAQAERARRAETRARSLAEALDGACRALESHNLGEATVQHARAILKGGSQ